MESSYKFYNTTKRLFGKEIQSESVHTFALYMHNDSYASENIYIICLFYRYIIHTLQRLSIFAFRQPTQNKREKEKNQDVKCRWKHFFSIVSLVRFADARMSSAEFVYMLFSHTRFICLSLSLVSLLNSRSHLPSYIHKYFTQKPECHKECG